MNFLQNNRIYKGDKILVFDWEGTPVKIIDLGERYYSFAVDEANKELVLLGTDQETYDYKLSKVSY